MVKTREDVNSTASHQRREVLYRGQVQGVGFRYTTRRIAQRNQVFGFVRNLPDGQVQLVVEGETAELEGFLAEVSQTMADYITEEKVQCAEARGDFQEFSIQY